MPSFTWDILYTSILFLISIILILIPTILLIPSTFQKPPLITDIEIPQHSGDSSPPPPTYHSAMTDGEAGHKNPVSTPQVVTVPVRQVGRGVGHWRVLTVASSVGGLVFLGAYGVLVSMVYVGPLKEALDYVMLGLNAGHAVFAFLANTLLLIHGVEKAYTPLRRLLLGLVIYFMLIYAQLATPVEAGLWWDVRIMRLTNTLSFLSALTVQIHAAVRLRGVWRRV
ncbi:hypothetical protein HDU67_008809 [Dinochytrium kinnereticum]|nr:hypothetical protein HDU67_008809 [Dinochytrium kinnereticum]